MISVEDFIETMGSLALDGVYQNTNIALWSPEESSRISAQLRIVDPFSKLNEKQMNGSGCKNYEHHFGALAT